MDFIHLHNHTEYSLLDGATRVREMVGWARENNMSALAITDHGVMFGVMEHYFECMKAGIKPILGMEAYVAPSGHLNKAGKDESQAFHLLLLARNEEGYRNLCRLHSIAALEGFYYRPRIDHDLLRQYAKGLIGSTTCLSSEVNRAFLAGDYERGKEIARMYKEIFDDGCYFVELQDHGIPEQKQIEPLLLQLAKELDLPLIATNDAHYLCKADSDPHDVLLCIGMGKQRADANRMRFEPEFYMKSQAEMGEIFRKYPEALSNTAHVAQMCNLEFGSQRALMPEPDLPSGMSPHQYLTQLAEKGLEERVRVRDDRAYERLNYELGIIETTGFSDYFLLVREFALFTRKQGIMFGVRGSAAASLVSFCIGITDVDPLEYDLTFERFLNPERVSMPDIDMDFQDDRRDEVIRYVTEKYGSDRVAQIVTFGTLGAKAAIRDVARVLGKPGMLADKLCKLIPGGPGWSLGKALKEIPDLREAQGKDPEVQEILDYASRIEGLSRHSGVHAAGVVIAKEPLKEIIPLYRSNEGQPVTAFEMGILEKIGLLKMDFLGLSNLSVIAKTIQNLRDHLSAQGKSDAEMIAEHPVLGPDAVAAIPEEDPESYAMLSRGETVGVFQLESEGMRNNIVKLRPNSIRELAAMVALYRPGPMQEIPRFIKSKHGEEPVTYLDERMKPILEETYGVIVYQDQVLKLVQALAGFSLGKADVLRRAMGKKIKEEMDKMKGEFDDGCAANGISQDVADQVWELLIPFSGYAFNKAHAVCYAIIAYQTAYLKANYKAYYLAALLSVYQSSEDRVIALIEECRRQGIPVLPPHVNHSKADFAIEELAEGRLAIRFGLSAIKGVGVGLTEKLIAERESGAYHHLYEFCERGRPAGLNRGSLEALIKAGALDGLSGHRGTLLANADAALHFADNVLRERAAGQDSLFGESVEMEIQYPSLPAENELDRSDVLAKEKEVMGIYVSDHPLRGYERTISEQATHRCVNIASLPDGQSVKLAGILSSVRTLLTKSKGERMAVLTLEDMTGTVGVTLFPATYEKFSSIVEKDRLVILQGVVSHRERNGGDRSVEIRVDQLKDLPRPSHMVLDESVAGHLVIKVAEATRKELERARDLLMEKAGDYEVILELEEAPETPIVLLNRVDASPGLIQQLKQTISRATIERIDNMRLT